ncbi:MAG: stage III sporulation protein AF, partial [Clostridia bacterium]|nr:stage III sporulation protein AF [Clostridia bacterium]
MKAYLLSTAGVIFLSVVVSLIVPEGKLHKSVIFVMRLICILVLIQPVTGIFKISSVSETSDFYDYEYISNVYSEHQSAELEKLISDKFSATSNCKVEVECVDGLFKVTSVSVELDKKNNNLINEIYAYLEERDYINIT